LGSERLKTAWAEFVEEEARLQNEANATSAKMGALSIEEKNEKKGANK
jgi:hypothetical protein